MNPALVVAFTLGVVAVFQAGLNRRISVAWGLAPTVFLNGAIVLVLCAAFLALATKGPLTTMVAPQADWKQLRWWWLLPGVGGFVLISGLPWAIARVGALQVFVSVVAAQMVGSLLWDALVEHIAVEPRRVAGAVLTVLGAAVVAWR